MRLSSKIDLKLTPKPSFRVQDFVADFEFGRATAGG